MIPLLDGDDPRFITIANQLLVSAVSARQPEELYLIKIDQWFDAKWLNFSGKVLGALGTWRRRITVPPFHPHRVVLEHHFVLNSASATYERAPADPLHIHQPSECNQSRVIDRVSASAIFFWYTGATLQLGRGSTMLYRSADGEVLSWYAAFCRTTSSWRLDRHRAISPEEVERQIHAV